MVFRFAWLLAAKNKKIRKRSTKLIVWNRRMAKKIKWICCRKNIKREKPATTTTIIIGAWKNWKRFQYKFMKCQRYRFLNVSFLPWLVVMTMMVVFVFDKFNGILLGEILLEQYKKSGWQWRRNVVVKTTATAKTKIKSLNVGKWHLWIWAEKCLNFDVFEKKSHLPLLFFCWVILFHITSIAYF